MANTLDSYMPKILATGLSVLRERCVMPRLVNSDYSTEAAEVGDVINIPKSRPMVTRAVVPGHVPVASPDVTSDNVQIPLETWEEAPFHLTDKDMLEIDKNRYFMPLQVAEAAKALANSINLSIMANYVEVYGQVGTPGTTPFASDASAAVDARKLLNIQLAPKTDRRGVLDADAEANAISLAAFRDADKTLSNQVIIEGEIGRKYAIDWVYDDHVPAHTAGDADSYITNGTPAAGAKTLAMDGGTGDPVVGDIFTIAGIDIPNHPGTLQQFVVTSLTGSAPTYTAVNFEPALPESVGDGVALTFAASGTVNLVFHRDAFAFAMRPLRASRVDAELGNRILSMRDTQTGIVLRLEVTRQHKQTNWSFDALWGSKCVRPESAVRLAG